MKRISRILGVRFDQNTAAAGVLATHLPGNLAQAGLHFALFGATKDRWMQVPRTPSKTPLPPLRRRKAEPQTESFALKTVLVASALLLCAVVMVEMEFYVSAPAHSLSEAEVALPRAPR